jgi:hypothetical protein
MQAEQAPQVGRLFGVRLACAVQVAFQATAGSTSGRCRAFRFGIVDHWQ